MYHYYHGCMFPVKHEKVISRIFSRTKSMLHYPYYHKIDIFDQQNPSPVLLNVSKKDTKFFSKSAPKLIRIYLIALL